MVKSKPDYRWALAVWGPTIYPIIMDWYFQNGYGALTVDWPGPATETTFRPVLTKWHPNRVKTVVLEATENLDKPEIVYIDVEGKESDSGLVFPKMNKGDQFEIPVEGKTTVGFRLRPTDEEVINAEEGKTIAKIFLK